MTGKPTIGGRRAILAAALLALTLLALASPALVSPALAARAPLYLGAARLIGAIVVNLRGAEVGRVEELVLAEDGRIASAVVAFDGFLGLDGAHDVDWAALTLREGDHGEPWLVLRASQERLAAGRAATTAAGPLFDERRLGQWRGRVVLDERRRRVGHVQDVVIDAHSGRPAFLVVAADAAADAVAVPWEAVTTSFRVIVVGAPWREAAGDRHREALAAAARPAR